MWWARRKSMTAGSRTMPSSIVKNTTGLEVGTREMIGATGPPWIATGVAGIVVVVLDVEVVVDPLEAQCRRELAACALRPPDELGPTNAHAPSAPTRAMTAATTHL